MARPAPMATPNCPATGSLVSALSAIDPSLYLLAGAGRGAAAAARAAASASAFFLAASDGSSNVADTSKPTTLFEDTVVVFGSAVGNQPLRCRFPTKSATGGMP